MSKKKDITALTMYDPYTYKSIVWFEKDNKKYMIPEILYSVFNIEVNLGNKIISRNRKLFTEMVVEFKKEDLIDLDPMMEQYLTKGRGKSNMIKCLTPAGVLQWISLLDYKRYDNETRDLIINTKMWIVKVAENFLYTHGNTVIGVDERRTIEWREQRSLCKQSNRFLNAAIKENLLEHHKSENARWLFINEAIMINKLAFGRHEKGIRDTAVPTEDLMKLYVAEISDATLCHQKVIDMNDRKEVIADMIDSYLPEVIIEDKKKLRGGQKSLEEFI